jgi:hypothetical protein
MKRIPLTRGKFALVDDDDYEDLSRFKWCTLVDDGRAYACRQERQKDGRQKKVFMHRQIAGIGQSHEVDHVNGDGLDNRRSNLRPCTHAENMRNRTRHHNNKSGYKGVSRVSRKHVVKWRASIGLNGKHIHLGYFATKVAAAKAYNTAALKYFGHFAQLNIV